MLKHLSTIAATFLVFISFPLLACDESAPCDKCAKASEFSWNPENQYVTARLSRFYGLNDQISAAYQANNFAKVEELAKENLALAAVYRCNWNYGNAVHNTNRVLGLVSLKNGDTETAAAYLLKAGKSTGSPQLNSFGPELDLANNLLQIDKVEPVKAYLKDIKSFWEMDHGKVDAWLKQIENGEKPELNRFVQNEPGLLMEIAAWLALAWPVIVTITFLTIQRKRLAKKWWFFLAAILVGYVVMAAGSWTISYVWPKLLINVEIVSKIPIGLIIFLPIAIALLLPVFAIFLLARRFRLRGDDIKAL